MNIIELKSAQARFEKRIESILHEKKDVYNTAKKFIKHFSINKIMEMSIEEYAIGSKLSNKDHKYHFCYTLERTLDRLGRITGSTSIKFGVYFGVVKGDDVRRYRFSKMFGDDYKAAFINIKTELYKLLEAGRDENLAEIAVNRLSPMFKGKILSVYYPDRYLNIFSNDHLNYYLQFFGLDTSELIKSNPIYKRERLLEFKNSDEIMKEWELDIFAQFLYSEYPGRPDFSTNTNDKLADYREPIFPHNQMCEFINLDLINLNNKNSKHNKSNGKKVDYVADARRKTKLGDRGEKLVFDMEVARLKDEGREDLIKKICRVSQKSDSYGYDILSYNSDGTKRYIEVKATSRSIGETNFYISANELRIAKEMGDDYYIYLVYDVKSTNPKIWVRNDLFTDCNKEKIELIPMNYKITINTKGKK